MAGEASSTARGASAAAPTSSSTSSVDSYNADDARRFLRQRNEACKLYSEATREAGRLESCLEATQSSFFSRGGQNFSRLRNASRRQCQSGRYDSFD